MAGKAKLLPMIVFFFLTSVNVNMFNLEKNNHMRVPKGNTDI